MNKLIISNFTKDEAQDNIRAVARGLRGMAKANDALYNFDLAEELFHMAKTLTDSADNLLKIESKEISDRYKETQQASANMLSACLVVAKKGKEG